MDNPEVLYYAALFLVALPAAWLLQSRIALLVLAAWTVSHMAFLMATQGFGVSISEIEPVEAWYKLFIYSAAFWVGWKWQRSSAGLFAVVLFIPLAVTCASYLLGLISALEEWWTIYWLAMAQVGALPFVRDFGTVRAMLTRKQGGGEGMFRVAHG